jgi:hypothetical protein
MVPPQDLQRNQPSQENLLLDYVHRLEKHKGGRRAAHIHLSALRPFNRREHHVRVASNSFEAMVKALQGQLFVLKNSDLFFVYKVEADAEAQDCVQRVRFLFSDDPLLTEEDEETEGPKFTTWYDVEAEFNEFLFAVQGLVDAEQQRQSQVRTQLDTRSALKARQEEGEPLTPEILARVETALERADLSNLVRRQYICGLGPKEAPEPEFSELFISIKDLRETLLPGVNLTSNRWLFQYLTQTLDRRMLAMLGKTDQITISGDISFNLNVSTLLSPEFLAFDDNVPAARRGAMVVELQKVDIFADLGAYLFAREFIQERGYRLCIDGLTYKTMGMVDRERLGADLVKLVWDPELVDGGDTLREKVHAMVRRNGENRMVLCRCDNREAIDFGRSIGVGLFQGRHVETLIAEDNRRRELMRLKRRIQRS